MTLEDADWIDRQVEPALYQELLERQYKVLSSSNKGIRKLKQVYELFIEQTPVNVCDKHGNVVGFVHYKCRVSVIKDPDGIAASIIAKHRCYREVLHDIVGYDS